MKKILIETTPLMRQYLKELLKTGLYGTTIEKAAERLLAQSIERELRSPNFVEILRQLGIQPRTPSRKPRKRKTKKRD